MKFNYVTIEREYGSGGTAIARRLAEETGIPCYGREILDAVAQELDITVADIERYEETTTNSFLYSAYIMAQASSGNTDMLSKEEHIFLAEQAAILRFAASGRAIFLGHCASEALKGQKDALRIFIRCSDETIKKARIIEDYGITEPNVDRVRKKFDKKRSDYYYAHTTTRWEDFRNYDVVFDSAALGTDGCVAMLKGLLV